MIHIRPRVGMYGAFSRLNYKPWYAVAEFVDNSIQSFTANKAALSSAGGSACLVVDIEVTPDRIVIKDNAAGISAAELPRAFLPAESPPDTSGLSEFGIGMKAAACWFSSRWMVRSSALGEPVERTIRFDVPRIVEQGIEDLEPEERPVASASHYTTVILESLHHQPKARTVTKIKSYLGGIYRRFLDDGRVRIRYNGEDVQYSPPEILVAPYYNDPLSNPITWRKDFRLDLDEQHRVLGWAALRERASTTEAGFAVFRRDRLIMGGTDSPYRPQEIFGTPNKFAYQRLFGELSVEGFGVSHTKDGLQWEEWEPDILDWLRAELDKGAVPLLRQAEGFRARAGRTPPPVGFGSPAVSRTTSAIQSHAGPVISEQMEREASSTEPAQELGPPEQLTASDEVEISLQHRQQKWRVIVELARDPGGEDWYTFALHHIPKDGPSILRIRINLSHPFSEQYLIGHEDDLDPVIRLAAGIAIAEVTAQEAGVQGAPTVRRNLNHLLREALWHRD
jgi:hypothetical protein